MQRDRDQWLLGPPKGRADATPHAATPSGGDSTRSAKAALGGVPRLRCDIAQEVAGLEQEEGLSVEYLRHYCEAEDLDDVTRLEIQVDAVTQSVELLGQHLKNLRHLRLTDSSVMCLRDLGSGLKHLEVLWMSRCGLQDLGGVGAVLPELREFYLPFNDVADLTPIGNLEHLEVLDVEGNAVADPQEVAVLRMCPQLRELTLSGNPVCRDASMPRQAIIDLLPQLTVLDDISTDPTAASSSAPAPRDLDLVVEEPGLDELLKDYGMDRHVQDAPVGCEEFEAVNSDEEESVDSGDDAGAGGASAPIRPLQTRHPLLAEGLQAQAQALDELNRYAGEPDEFELVTERIKRPRPKASGQSMTARPAVGGWGFNVQIPDRRQVRTADSDPTSFRPATAGSLGLDFRTRSSEDTSSDLTCGTLLAGNPLAVARQRRTNAAEAGGAAARESDMNIRDLLRRYQTYTQESCIPAAELAALKRGAREVRDGGDRPATPDVRFSSHTDSGEVAGARPSSGSGRGRALVSSSGRDGAASKPKPSGGYQSSMPPKMPLSSPGRNGAAVPPTMKMAGAEVLTLEGPKSAVDLE